jgi:hypothetical protein
MGVIDNNNLAQHYFCPSIYYTDYYWFSDWDTNLGEPVGDYFEVPGTTDCYRRNFKEGVVLVNPTDNATGSFELGGMFYTLDSQAVTQANLSAREGLILLGSAQRSGGFQDLTIVDDASGTSAWWVENAALIQSSNIYSGSLDGTVLPKLGTYALLDTIGSSVTDYQLTLSMKSEDNDAIGVMFFYQDSNNYYRFSWDRERAYRRLVKCENGEFTLLAEDEVSYEIGQTYQVKIAAQGTTIQVWIDGASVFSVTDSSFSGGKIAFYCWGNAGSYFDDILVQDIPTGTTLFWTDFSGGVDPDAPSPPTGLAIVTTSP